MCAEEVFFYLFMAIALTDEAVEKTVALSKLILKFARVHRATVHEDGVTPETDTDHTVMLGIIACAFADAFKPELDRGRVAQFALVHDLVEAYTGDVNTINVSQAQLDAKEVAELAALERIKAEFGSVYPWIHTTIEEYESQVAPEARFVKTIDKAMPSLLHVLNGSTTLYKQGFSKDALIETIEKKNERLRAGCGADQPEAMMLRTLLVEKFLENY